MKLLVISDTHGKTNNLDKIIELEKPDYIIFCGDGEKDILNYENVIGVSGNCDFYNFLPNSQTINLLNKKIFLTHGHLFCVKSGLNKLMYFAETNKIDIVIFGHTHSPFNEYIEKTLFFNPGSYNYFEFNRYGIIELNEEIKAYLKTYN